MAGQRMVQKLIGGHQRRHAGRGGATHAGAEGNALVELHGKAEIEIERAPQRHQRGPRRVVLRVGGQAGCAAANGVNAHFGAVDAAHGHRVARAVNAVAEQVETGNGVANAGWRKGARRVLDGRVHSGAPSWPAMRSTSANTPAAVTSGPAPGPWTTSGLLQ